MTPDTEPTQTPPKTERERILEAGGTYVPTVEEAQRILDEASMRRMKAEEEVSNAQAAEDAATEALVDAMDSAEGQGSDSLEETTERLPNEEKHTRENPKMFPVDQEVSKWLIDWGNGGSVKGVRVGMFEEDGDNYVLIEPDPSEWKKTGYDPHARNYIAVDVNSVSTVLTERGYPTPPASDEAGAAQRVVGMTEQSVTDEVESQPRTPETTQLDPEQAKKALDELVEGLSESDKIALHMWAVGWNAQKFNESVHQESKMSPPLAQNKELKIRYAQGLRRLSEARANAQ